MANLQDRSLSQKALEKRMAEEWPGSAFYDGNAIRAVQQKVDLLAAHMYKQQKEHETAMLNTFRVFEYLLQDLDSFAACFKAAFEERLPEVNDLTSPQIRYLADPDRSVGILHVLWHAISFTTRGNTKPLALNRPGRPPLFTGRIIALQGDFLDTHSNLHPVYFGDLLDQEIASLYVPADPNAPAVMQMKHLNGEELYFHQADAPRRFLLKVVEVVCGGGFFHEQ
jgi:hypothetical protein